MMTTEEEPVEDGLVIALRRSHGELQAAMSRDWHRDLPYEELVFDRWERAQRLGFGAKASIYHMSYVYGDVAVGKGTWIGPFTLLDGTGGLTIGEWCSISAGVHIYTHDTVRRALSGGRTPAEKAPVVIEDRCYIGPSAVVSRGVRIGTCSVVGAHAFVNRDVAPYSIMAGIPARQIGSVRIDGEAITFDYPKPE